MQWGPVIAGASTIVVAVTPALREWTAARGVRTRLKQDIELVGLLPAESAARKALEAHIERTVERLVEEEHEMRRDPGGFVLALFFTAVTAFLGMRAIDGSDIWWVPAGLMAIFTIAAFAVSVPKARRTPTGRIIKDVGPD